MADELTDEEKQIRQIIQDAWNSPDEDSSFGSFLNSAAKALSEYRRQHNKGGVRLELSALREALMKDFNALYVKGYAVDWEVKRVVRNTEIEIMDFTNVLAADDAENRHKMAMEEASHR